MNKTQFQNCLSYLWAVVITMEGNGCVTRYWTLIYAHVSVEIFQLSVKNTKIRSRLF